jgi:hypothetical protein
MKTAVVSLALLAGLAWADQDGNPSPGAPLVPSHDPGTDLVTISVIETWTPGVSQILGLDWYNYEDGYVLMASATEDRINRWDANAEALAGFIDLVDTNANCFGVAAGPEGFLFTSNDWTQNSLYVRSSGGAWGLESNPAGTNGRGMEYDEDSGQYWEAATSGTTYTLYRFVPDVGSATYNITQPQDNLSGLAVFPYSGDLGIVVTSYDDHHFYFYVYDGSTVSYLGSAACPGMSGLQSSLGICYADSRDTFFWSWSDGTTYYLTELDIDQIGLAPATWGSIKTLF